MTVRLLEDFHPKRDSLPDPAYGTHKTLAVAYSVNGETGLWVSRDDRPFALPMEAGPADGAADELRRIEFAEPVSDLTITPDGRQLLVGIADGTARLRDIATGREIRRFEGHSKGLVAVAINPAGDGVLTGGVDRKVRLWNAATGREVRTLSGHTETVMGVAFAPGGRRAASGALDRTLRVWDLDTGREVRAITGFGQAVEAVRFTPDGRQVLGGSWDGTMRLWDAATGQEVLSPDGRRALSADGNAVVLWDVGTGRVVRRFERHTDQVTALAFTPDGRRWASSSQDKTVRLWRLPEPDRR